MHERSTNILFTSSNLLYSMIFARRCFLKEIMFQNITSSSNYSFFRQPVTNETNFNKLFILMSTSNSKQVKILSILESFNLAQTCCSDDQRLMDRWKHSLLTPIQRNVILS
ncbi:hypothetical protein T4E_3799 [Trichinella pseudospiralis]|uniref:Uncharacterized protein n=1 Tax=Trichinella pseudospiralis TaxID=6337 RepID=A0A0V0YB68_TRIPS|nr:hypothetical protein T4E_3799 [Trichinella pseudospiralis]